MWILNWISQKSSFCQVLVPGLSCLLAFNRLNVENDNKILNVHAMHWGLALTN